MRQPGVGIACVCVGQYGSVWTRICEAVCVWGGIHMYAIDEEAVDAKVL